MTLAQDITRHYNGDWHGSYGSFPAPGHSKDDRGVTVKDADSGEVVFNTFNGADWREIKDECRRLGLLPERERANDNTSPPRTTGTYEYDDGSGNVIYRTRRIEQTGKRKRFVAERPEGGRWINGIRGLDRFPYRFTELCRASAAAREAGEPLPLIYFAEGERKADKLASWGLVATAIAFGANGWTDGYGEAFRDRTVIILPDNDDQGRQFAAKVKAGVEAYGATAHIVELPGLRHKGDIMDWTGTADDLRRLTDKALAGNLLPNAANDAGVGDYEVAPPLGSGFAAGQRNPKRKEPSEDDVALAFTAQHGETLRFDHDAGQWFEWDGTRWRPDTKHRAFTYARVMARHFDAAGKANFAAGVERFARADPAHACNADLWNADPMLLGTPTGTVDLRTGDCRQPAPGDYITKVAGCAPEPGEPTRWLEFLHEALAGDQEAIRFLRLWMGYCLTGDTREHALIFLHGLAGTGKSVFLNTLAAILGDYAVTAAMETFTASKFDRHSTELAMLAGARLVTASETEEGRAWAEAKVKQMTGGDKITARFMRQDNFTFRPQFKLTIVGNHAPRLTNPDDAMRRRFNILGFNVKPAKPDLQLEDRLRAEHGRILSWAIAGCLEWQAGGLIRPAAVVDATAEYFAGEDLMGQWLEERCIRRPGAFELPAALYRDWCRYAGSYGEEPGTANSFGKKMAKLGLGAKASNSVRQHKGIELKPEPRPEWEGYGHD